MGSAPSAGSAAPFAPAAAPLAAAAAPASATPAAGMPSCCQILRVPSPVWPPEARSMQPTFCAASTASTVAQWPSPGASALGRPRRIPATCRPGAAKSEAGEQSPRYPGKAGSRWSPEFEKQIGRQCLPHRASGCAPQPADTQLSTRGAWQCRSFFQNKTPQKRPPTCLVLRSHRYTCVSSLPHATNLVGGSCRQSCTTQPACAGVCFGQGEQRDTRQSEPQPWQDKQQRARLSCNLRPRSAACTLCPPSPRRCLWAACPPPARAPRPAPTCRQLLRLRCPE